MNTYQGFPEKWCVVRNKSTYKEVNKWFNQNSGGFKFTADGEYIHGGQLDHLHFPKCGSRHIFGSVQEGYTLITFSDFLINIVNKPIDSYQIY